MMCEEWKTELFNSEQTFMILFTSFYSVPSETESLCDATCWWYVKTKRFRGEGNNKKIICMV